MGTGKALLRYIRKDFQAKEINLVPKIRIEDVQLFLKGTDWSAITDDIDSCSLLPNNFEVGHRKNYFTFPTILIINNKLSLKISLYFKEI